MEPLVRLDRLTTAGRGKPTLEDVSLSLHRGEVLALLGPAGCGKSVLLKMMSGRSPAPVWFDSPPPERGHLLLPQDGGETLLPWLSLRDNALIRFDETPPPMDAELVAVAEELGVAPLPLDLRPGQCDAAQCQAAAVCRTLLAADDVVLLDEPLDALEAADAACVAPRLRESLLRRNLTAAFATRRPEVALLLADRVCVLGREPVRVLAEREVGEVPRRMDHPAFAALLADLLLILRNRSHAAGQPKETS